jgi:tRNA-2-methylthio-N6-dimethylallyladenosine synthase
LIYYVQLIQEIGYDLAFMFKYSEREGPHALKKTLDDVPEGVKGERLQQIIKLQGVFRGS